MNDNYSFCQHTSPITFMETPMYIQLIFKYTIQHRVETVADLPHCAQGAADIKFLISLEIFITINTVHTSCETTLYTYFSQY